MSESLHSAQTRFLLGVFAVLVVVGFAIILGGIEAVGCMAVGVWLAGLVMTYRAFRKNELTVGQSIGMCSCALIFPPIAFLGLVHELAN